MLHRSLVQAGTTIGAYVGICAIMYATIGHSHWIALAPLAAGFLVRMFIIQHDCGHGAYFRSRRANDVLGVLCSLFTLTPYSSWRRQHAGHHGVWNNLDRRSSGADIYSACLTTEEFRALSSWRQRWYRLSRNPLIANIVLPPLVFLVLYRTPFDMPKEWRRERRAVYLTDLALFAALGSLGAVVGFGHVVAVQLLIMVPASIVGVWLFTVQHRSDTTVWARQEEWDALGASLKSTTYLRLSPILRWFTGNIGLHHVHHLNPKIPNYRLQLCHDSVAELRDVPAMSLRSALRAMLLVLWDEESQKLVPFHKATRGLGSPRRTPA